jgi:WD40 repeat protein
MVTPTKHNNLATMPIRKTKVDSLKVPMAILLLPDGKRIIVHSLDGSFRVWDLETDTQVGEEWEDKMEWGLWYYRQTARKSQAGVLMAQ